MISKAYLSEYYWVGLDNTGSEWDSKPKGMPVSQYATQLILEGKSITLYDLEDEAESWTLDIYKFCDGIGKAISRNYDIEDEADAVLQLALFDDIIYG